MRSQAIERPRRSHASRALKATAAAVVAAVVGALVVVVPAQAATTDRSEAEASLVGGSGIVSLDQVAALGGAYSAFGTTQNPPTARNPLNLTVVNALSVGLGNGFRLLGANGLLQLGVDGQYADATATGATASAGLIGADGSIAAGSGTPGAGATLNLQPLLASVPATNGVLSDVRLGLGALSSQISQQRGATAGTPTTAYQVAGARYTMTSPAVQGVTTSLRGTVTGLGSTVNAVAGSGAVTGLATSITAPLTTAVNGLPLGGAVTLGQPVVGVTATVDLDSTISTELARPLTSGPVTITPSTGQVIIDFGALNGLPANSDLLSPAAITAITNGVTDILQNQLPTNLVAAANAAVRSTAATVDLRVGLGIDLGLATVNETLTTRTVTTIGQLLDGTTPATATTVTGSGLVGALGATVLRTALLPVVGTLLGSVGGLYSPLVNGTALAATTTALRTTTAAVVTTLAPLTTLLNQLVRVTINAQDGVGFRDGRGTDAGSSSVHAVSLSVLPLVNASRVDLATSTVRAAALAPLSIATPTAGQVFVVPAAPGATRSVVLTGAGEPGATVSVDLGAGLTGTGTVAADGSWSVTVATVPAGAYSASVTQALGTVTTGPVTRDFTVVAQQPLVVTAPTAGRVFTVLDADSTTPVIVSGTATPTATVAVDLGGGRTATALVAADGTWTTTVPGVPVGSYTASVTQALGGDVSAAATRAFSVVAGAGLTITSPTSGTQYRLPGADSTRDVTVSGTGQAGAPVAVSLGGGRDLTATVAANGTWSATFPALPVATYTATATQTVGGAVSAPQTTDFALVAATGVTISTPAPGATLTVADPTSTTLVTVTGAAEPNAPVRVDLGDGYVATTTADGTGAWSATVSSVPVGTRTISVTQTVAGVDSVPVTQPLTVAAGAPLVIDAPAEGTTVRVASSASLSTLTVSGTAQAGADVRVDLGDGLTGRVTADATTGAWSVDVADVPVGQRTISATQTVGGTVSPAQTRVVTIVAGTPVAISTPAPGATIPIVGGTTADVTVTGTADPGATVTVGLGAGFEVPATVDPATGAWTAVIPDVPAGVRTLGATQTLGGTTSAPVTQPLTIAQGTPLDVTAPLDGAEYFVPEPQDTTPVVVSGTGQVGATVAVDLGDGLVGQVVVPTSGQWSVTVAGVPVGPHTVSVTQSVNGSTSDALTRDIRVSVGGDVVITTPVPGTQLVVADDQGTAPITIAGTGVAGLPVTVTVDGVDQAPVATDVQGAWSLVLTGVAVGDHVVGASQQQGPDLLEAAPTSFSVVSAEADLTITAPGDGDVITVAGAGSTTAVVVTGTAYPGASVEVTLAGVTTPTTAGPDGLWTVTVPGVPVGDQVASATQTVGGTTTTEPVTRAFEVVSGSDVVITTPAADIRYVVASAGATQDVPVAGTAQPGALVTVTLDGVAVGEALADPSSGAWAVTLAGVGVGERVLGASQSVRDTIQQAETRVVTVDPAAALTIVAPADGVPIVLADPTSTTTLVVSGQAEPGATVRVDLGDGVTDTVAAGTTTGAWSISFDDVPVGTRTIVATQTVGASVSAPETRVVQILAGAPLVVVTPADGSVVDVAGPDVVSTVTVSGTAAAGATVDVVLDPATGADLVATVAADPTTGAWSVDVAGVPVGAVDLSVTQSIGGTTSPAQESSFEVRAAAPVVIVDPDDSVFTVLDPVGTVDVPVSGTASPGAEVSVRLNGGAAVTTTADPASGDWSVVFADLPVATYQVTASQAVAGTTSTPVLAAFEIVAGDELTVLQPTPGAVVTVADATASTAVTVNGTAEPGATVRVDLGDDLVASTIADPTTGAWSVVVAGVTVGERTLTATQALGTSVSPAVTQPLSVVPAAAVVIEAPAVGTVVAVATPDATTDLVVSGTAEPGASIGVDLGDGLTATATADGTTGAWSVTVPGVPVGDRTIAVTQTVDGSTSTPVTRDVSIVVAPAAPAIVTPTPGATVSLLDPAGTTSVVVSGTGEPGATIAVSLGTGFTAGATVGPEGQWQTTVDGVPVGDYTLTATQTIRGAISAAATQPFTVAAAAGLVVDRPTDGTTVVVLAAGDTAPVVASGTAQPGATVTVDLGDGLVGTVVADPTTGAWSLTVDGVPVGDRTASVTQTVDGAVSTPITRDVSIVVAAPVTITSPPAGSSIVVEDADDTTDVTVTGTGQPGATVVVAVGDDLSETTTVTPEGTWTVTVGDVPVGSYPVVVTQTVPAGSTTPATQQLDVVVGTPVTITEPAPGATVVVLDGQTTPVTVSGTAQPGATVTVSLGDDLTQAVPADPTTGAWTTTFDAAPVGAGPISVLQQYGTVTTVPVTQPFAVVAADPIEITDPATGTRLLVLSADSTVDLPVTGSAQVGATVAVTLDDGTAVTVDVDDDGTWSTTFSGVGVGEHVVSATQTVAGVESAPVTTTVVVEAAATLTVTAPTDGQQYQAGDSGTAPVVVRGQGQPGAPVAVTVDGGDPVTTTVDDAGSWQVPVVLGTGTHTVSVVQTVGDATSVPVEVQVVIVPAPADPAAAPTITSPADGQLVTDADGDGFVDLPVTGTGEPGATVTVSVGGTTQTATVTAGGTWSVTLPAVPVGTRTVVVEQTVAGVVTGSASVVVTLAPAAEVAPLVVTSPDQGSILPAGTEGTADVLVGGSAQPNASVAVSLDGGLPVTVDVAADGTWSTTLAAVEQGRHTLSVTQTVGGAVSAPETVVFTVTAAANTDAVVITSPAPGALLADVDGNGVEDLTVTGTGTPGALVTVDLGDGLTQTTTVAGDGTWTAAFADVPVGAYVITATQTADDGTTTATQDLLIASVDPVVITSPVAGSVLPAGQAGTTSVTVVGTAEPGATVTVQLDGDGATRSVTADPQTGDWTVVLADVAVGSHVVAATQTVAGATSAPVTTGFTVSAAAGTPGTPGTPGIPGTPGFPGLPGAAGGSGTGTGGGAVVTGSTSGLAYTGSDALGWFSLAAFALLIGLGLVSATRVRRRARGSAE